MKMNILLKLALVAAHHFAVQMCCKHTFCVFKELNCFLIIFDSKEIHIEKNHVILDQMTKND